MPEFFRKHDEILTALSPREALEFLREGAALLDVREPYETNYRVLDVPRAFQVPNSVFMERCADIPRDTPLIVLDNVGVRSKEIARLLLEKGYPDVAWVVGGVVDWVRDGLPLQVDPNYELIGQCSCKLRPKNPKEAPKWKK